MATILFFYSVIVGIRRKDSSGKPRKSWHLIGESEIHLIRILRLQRHAAHAEIVVVVECRHSEYILVGGPDKEKAPEWLE